MRSKTSANSQNLALSALKFSHFYVRRTVFLTVTKFPSLFFGAKPKFTSSTGIALNVIKGNYTTPFSSIFCILSLNTYSSAKPPTLDPFVRASIFYTKLAGSIQTSARTPQTSTSSIQEFIFIYRNLHICRQKLNKVEST